MAVLYVKIVPDGNQGPINVAVRSTTATLASASINAGDTFEQTFENVTTGPQQFYFIDLNWPDFHNITDGPSVIAWAPPGGITANNALLGWQVSGNHAFATISLLIPPS